MSISTALDRLRAFSPAAKAGIVAGGYVAAFLIATGVVWIYVSQTMGPDRDASSGMYAFGDAMLFLVMFSAAAVIPTGAGLYFLRPYRPFWIALSGAALIIAATGVAAIVTYFATRSAEQHSVLHLWGAFAVLRLLVAPIFAGGFFGAGILAPGGRWRPILFIASAIEAAIFACMVLAWVVAS